MCVHVGLSELWIERQGEIPEGIEGVQRQEEEDDDDGSLIACIASDRASQRHKLISISSTCKFSTLET